MKLIEGSNKKRFGKPKNNNWIIRNQLDKTNCYKIRKKIPFKIQKNRQRKKKIVIIQGESEDSFKTYSIK